MKKNVMAQRQMQLAMLQCKTHLSMLQHDEKHICAMQNAVIIATA